MRDSAGKLISYSPVQKAEVYLNAFLASNKTNPERAAAGELESIVKTLISIKSFDGRHSIYLCLQDRLKYAIKTELYEDVAQLRDAITYYHKHILD